MLFSLFAYDYNLFSSLLYNEIQACVSTTQISLSTLLFEVYVIKIKET